MAKRRGAVFLYQGHRCSSFRFRRTRGYETDHTIITLPASAFPDGFEVDEPKQPGDLSGAVPPDASDVEAMLAGRASELPRKLRFTGWLVVADLSDDVYRNTLVLGPLYVLRVDRLRKSARSGMAMLQVTLVDERYFWGSRGFLRRWSLNRVRGDGSIALDSVRPDGSPFTRADVAREVVGNLFRAPRLASLPEEWNKFTGPIEFAPHAPAVIGVGDLVRQGKTEEPCLRLDGAVALHKPGDGLLGYAQDGKGPNTQPFPPGAILSKHGSSPGYSVELAYPDDFLVVLGKERIKTVALDECEAVLVVPMKVRKAFLEVSAPGPQEREFFGETVVLLNEQTVRALTRNKYGLKWLTKWVLLPPTWQNAVGLEESVAQLFRDQAWRLWRILGVEVEGKPGPNAHLLPLLPRAEQTASGRLPVTVEIYGFHMTHRAMMTSATNETLLRARATMERIKKTIQDAAVKKGVPDPFSGGPDTYLEVNGLRFFDRDPRPGDRDLLGGRKGPPTFGELLGEPFGQLMGAHTQHGTGISLEQAEAMLGRARAIDRAKQVDESFGSAYEAALKESLKAGDEANGTANSELYELAERALKLQKEIEEKPEQANGLRAAAARDFEAVMRRIAQKVDQTQQRRDAGLDAAELLEKSQYAHFVRNRPRDIDARASVFSDRLGIVRTSRLAGWVEKEGVRSPERTRFVPKPVRVLFGAVLRPKIDKPPPQITTSQARGASTVRVPPELSDEITRFRRAYQRSATGPVPIDPAAIPPGEGTVVPINAHELIPLDGEGNTAELEQQADEIAQGRLATKPKVEGATVILGRAWPIQTDGLINSVEIYSRDGGAGIETKVTIGSGRAPDPNPFRSRARPPHLRPDADAGRREGTAP